MGRKKSGGVQRENFAMDLLLKRSSTEKQSEEDYFIKFNEGHFGMIGANQLIKVFGNSEEIVHSK